MKLITDFFVFIIICALSVYGIHEYIHNSTIKKIYNTTQSIPYNKVGLLLGTSKYTSRGTINLYYKYRIQAAVELFNSGKISYILVSGDNRKHSYNEPEEMMRDLVQQGVPENKIFLDYAGFRTLDSVIRAQKIFGQNSFTCISQQFHNERALNIAEFYNIHAIAYNAKDVGNGYGWKITIREYFARVKLLLDYAFGVGPHFLGESIQIQ